MKRKVIPLFIAVALTIAVFYWVRGAAFCQMNGNNFGSFMFGSYSETHPIQKEQYPDFWKSRYLGCELASRWLDLVNPRTNLGYLNTVGSFYAAWLFGTFLILIVGVAEPILPMLGVVAGLMYSAAPDVHPYVIPYDFAAMFFFTAAFVAYRCRRWGWLVACVIIGGWFKETVLVASLFLLAAPCSRLLTFPITVILVSGVQWLTSALQPYPCDASWLVALRGGRISQNLHRFFEPHLNHVLLANAGGLVLLAAALFKSRDTLLNLVIIYMIVGEMFGAVTDEFRVWYELLPIGWVMVNEVFVSQRSQPQIQHD